MIKVIIYDEACEILNMEDFLKEEVEVVSYLKNNREYFYESINDIKVCTIKDFKEDLDSIEFDFIIINSRYSNFIYENLRELRINPEKIIDVSFFSYDFMSSSFKEKLLYCKENSLTDFNTLFIGRNYIKEEVIGEYFNDYINISNRFLDLHYDYHLLYYLIKNNKINENVRVGIFTNYSMLYENIDLVEGKYEYIKIFEDMFSVHKNVNFNNTYFSLCHEGFKNNSSKLFRDLDFKELRFIDEKNISEDNEEKIKYDVQTETINYKESNIVAFKMNKNLIIQILKMLHENNIQVFFIIPPVSKYYKTYINNTLKKEFYMVLNKHMSENIHVFDYFDLNFEDKYFSSPCTLNEVGSNEFLKSLSYDINEKFSCVKICNDL